MIERRINDIRIGRAPTVSPGTTPTEAARTLRDADTPAVVVWDDRVVGLITESEVVSAVAETGTVLDAGSIMSTSVEAVSSETTLLEAAERMRAHDIRCLPVVDGTNYRGVVSAEMLAPYLSRHRFDTEPATVRTTAGTNDTMTVRIRD